MLERLKSFDEFLERRFPGSRRKTYYLMAIHEKLPVEIIGEVGTLGADREWIAAECGLAIKHLKKRVRGPNDGIEV
jgi:hypothetical protein